MSKRRKTQISEELNEEGMSKPKKNARKKMHLTRESDLEMLTQASQTGHSLSTPEVYEERKKNLEEDQGLSSTKLLKAGSEWKELDCTKAAITSSQNRKLVPTFTKSKKPLIKRQEKYFEETTIIWTNEEQHMDKNVSRTAENTVQNPVTSAESSVAKMESARDQIIPHCERINERLDVKMQDKNGIREINNSDVTSGLSDSQQEAGIESNSQASNYEEEMAQKQVSFSLCVSSNNDVNNSEKKALPIEPVQYQLAKQMNLSMLPEDRSVDHMKSGQNEEDRSIDHMKSGQNEEDRSIDHMKSGQNEEDRSIDHMKSGQKEEDRIDHMKSVQNEEDSSDHMKSGQNEEDSIDLIKSGQNEEDRSIDHMKSGQNEEECLDSSGTNMQRDKLMQIILKAGETDDPSWINNGNGKDSRYSEGMDSQTQKRTNTILLPIITDIFNPTSEKLNTSPCTIRANKQRNADAKETEGLPDKSGKTEGHNTCVCNNNDIFAPDAYKLVLIKNASAPQNLESNVKPIEKGIRSVDSCRKESILAEQNSIKTRGISGKEIPYVQPVDPYSEKAVDHSEPICDQIILQGSLISPQFKEDVLPESGNISLEDTACIAESVCNSTEPNVPTLLIQKENAICSERLVLTMQQSGLGENTLIRDNIMNALPSRNVVEQTAMKVSKAEPKPRKTVFFSSDIYLADEESAQGEGNGGIPDQTCILNDLQARFKDKSNRYATRKPGENKISPPDSTGISANNVRDEMKMICHPSKQEDATEVVYGLIKELSNLNRLTMSTHRDLDSFKRLKSRRNKAHGRIPSHSLNTMSCAVKKKREL